MVYGIEVLTGSNKHGLFTGQLQTAGEDNIFRTVASFSDGHAMTVLQDSHVKSIRLLATSDQLEPVAIREVKLQLMKELSGKIDPDKEIGEGNIGVVKADASFGPRFAAELPVLVKDATLRFDSGGGIMHLF